MGYDLVLGLLYMVLGPLVIVGFALTYRAAHRRRKALEEVWRRQAEGRGRTFVAATGGWPERTSPRIEWSAGGHKFRLEMVSLRREVHTRLLVASEGAFAGRVYVGPASGGPAGLEDVDVGDARFRAQFVARARPVVLGQNLLDAEVRSALVTFAQGEPVSLRYRKGQLVLLWPGVETNAARVDEAERLLAASADRLGRTFRHAA